MDAAPLPRLDRETLLAHRPWVRALAVSLTRDPADADDVEQEAWLAALDRAPADLRTPRAWFVTVVRNAARKVARGDARRRRREEAIVPREPEPSAAELTARAEAHRCVVAAVLALDDVHREAVLLRYFEGLPVADVARRAGVPLETARARLRRARAKLREQLAAEHGGGDRWRLALVPLVGLVPSARDGATAATVAIGGALVASKTVVACGVALLVAGAAWWQFGGDGGTIPVTGDTSTAPASDGDGSAPPPRPRAATERAAASTEEALPAPAPPVPAPRVAEAPRRTAAERLADPIEPIDLADLPVAAALGHVAEDSGVRIVLAKDVAVRLAANPGRAGLCFEGRVAGRQLLETLARVHGLDVRVEEDRAVVVPAGAERAATIEVVAVPKPSSPLPTYLVRGTVSDERGASVSGASVVRTFDGHTLATSDANGGFEFRVRRPLPTVEARAPGRVRSLARAVVVASDGTEPMDLVIGPASGTLVVRVTSGGTPVDHAAVRIAVVDEPVVLEDGSGALRKRQRGGMTSEDGRFVCDDAPPGTFPVVVSTSAHIEVSKEVVVVAGERTEVEIVLVAKPSLRQTLDTTRVSFAFRENRMDEIVNFLSHVSRINIVVMPDAREHASTAKVTLSAKDLPLSQALKDVCDGVGGLTFDLDEESRLVTIKKRAE